MKNPDELDVSELARIIATATPREMGTVTKEELLAPKRFKRPKAVLFIPEELSLEDDLQIEVVGLNAAVMAAMVARRC